jgi:hypothetical protein
MAHRKLLIVLAMLGMAGFTVPAALLQSNVIPVVCISIMILSANAFFASAWAFATAAAPEQLDRLVGLAANRCTGRLAAS